MRTLELVEQGGRYQRMLAEVLASHLASPTDPAPRTVADYMQQIEVIFVLGDWPENPGGDRDPSQVAAHLRPIRGRIVTYNQLIGSARRAYDAYLREHTYVNRVAQIADALLKPTSFDPASNATDHLDNDQ